jgi:hypothetical protein
MLEMDFAAIAAKALVLQKLIPEAVENLMRAKQEIADCRLYDDLQHDITTARPAITVQNCGS